MIVTGARMNLRACLFIGVSLVFAHAAMAAEPERPLTIGLMGDSTVASTYGWGPAFADQCKDRTKVMNYARNGATLDSLSGMLDELIRKKPDYILVQFGHNDMKRYDATAYSAKLKGYVERIKKGGCKPVIISSVTRRNFDGNGRIKPSIMNGDRSLPIFSKSAQAVAKGENVPFIDLNAVSIEHHNKIGPAASAAYNFNATDTTHFSKEGAKAIAALVITELKAVVPELAACFK